MVLPIRDWSVDYGSGPEAVSVPHVWHLAVPLEWEGPAVYRTSITVPAERASLVFRGASYEAVVLIQGEKVLAHRGIWDAFAVDVSPWQGKEVEIEVRVTKNGGGTWPVPQVASGFLPYVYGTFGGLFREVELVVGEGDLTALAPPSRVSVEGGQICVDGKPFYARGVLTWGWYPDLAAPHLPPERIAQEIQQLKALGFNLIKFCLWLPPHDYLRQMRDAGLMAWIELPLWLPAGDQESLKGFREEVIRIVDQYAGHDNVLAWTLGCELSESTPADFRAELVEHLKARTGSPLVKDNSGGAEMYGGDPREFGDFDDFHPYCDTHFYPVVLDSLLPGPRPKRPILLGEFNDYDVCRDLEKVEMEDSFWASERIDINAQGVRWMHDLPRVMKQFRQDESLRERLPRFIESSRGQSLFMRKFVQEQVRARDEISGFVVTGWADTPISTSGFLDDWGHPRFEADDISAWNSDDALFLVPSRMPPWVEGGNRPGWRDFFCHWNQDLHLQFGLHTTTGASEVRAAAQWDGSEVPIDLAASEINPLKAAQIGSCFLPSAEPGEHIFSVKTKSASNQWPMTVVQKPPDVWPIILDDPRRAFFGTKADGAGPRVGTNPDAEGIVILLDEGTLPRPFWREAAHEWDDEFWGDWSRAWHRLLAIAPDRALDPLWLRENLDDYKVVWKRLDTRTFEELPIAAVGRRAEQAVIVTTLRPFGGLGIQPFGVNRSPAGTLLLQHLIDSLSTI